MVDMSTDCTGYVRCGAHECGNHQPLCCITLETIYKSFFLSLLFSLPFSLPFSEMPHVSLTATLADPFNSAPFSTYLSDMIKSVCLVQTSPEERDSLDSIFSQHGEMQHTTTSMKYSELLCLMQLRKRLTYLIFLLLLFCIREHLKIPVIFLHRKDAVTFLSAARLRPLPPLVPSSEGNVLGLIDTD